jgi:hypothetical protein
LIDISKLAQYLVVQGRQSELISLLLSIEIQVQGVSVPCFAFNAVCVAVEIGLLASEVLSTFHNPTVDLLTWILITLSCSSLALNVHT